MKYLIDTKDNKAVNLATTDEIYVSGNYLKISTGGGLGSRDIHFIYGATEVLNALFARIMEFLASDEKTFDCREFINGLK